MLSCQFLGCTWGMRREIRGKPCVSLVSKNKTLEFSPSVDGVLNLKPGELEEKPGGGIPKVSWLLFGILCSRGGTLSQLRPE